MAAEESIFGPIISGSQFESSVTDTLRTWLPTYIQELERQMERQLGQIPIIKQFTTRNEFTSFPDDILPLCVVVCPGLADTPTKEGDGTYSGWWALGVGFAAVARDVESAMFLAKFYAAAARAILLHRQSLGGLSAKIEWVDEKYDELVTEDDRSVRATYLTFRVLGYGLVQEYAGPAVPNVDPADPGNAPGSTWPTADTVTIDAINLLG